MSLQKRKAVWTILQLSGNTLQQVDKFKCIGIHERTNKEIDTRIGKANATLSIYGDKNEAFNFKIGLGSDPHLWPRILNID